MFENAWQIITANAGLIALILLGLAYLGYAAKSWFSRTSNSRFFSTEATLVELIPVWLRYETIIQRKETGGSFEWKKHIVYAPVFRITSNGGHEEIASTIAHRCFSNSDIGKSFSVRVRPGKNPIIIADEGDSIKNHNRAMLRNTYIFVFGAAILFITAAVYFMREVNI